MVVVEMGSMTEPPIDGQLRIACRAELFRDSEHLAELGRGSADSDVIRAAGTDEKPARAQVILRDCGLTIV